MYEICINRSKLKYNFCLFCFLFFFIVILVVFFSLLSSIPPCRRKPCLGRNIEDSDADLYAEYHGGGLGSRSSSETSLHDNQRDDLGVANDGRGDGVRIRKGRHTCPSSHPDLAAMWRKGDKQLQKSGSRQSLELSNLDFSTSINTEFSSLEPCNQTSSEAGYEFQRWFEGLLFQFKS